MSGKKTLQKSKEGIFQDEKAIKTQRCGKPPKNTKSSCAVWTSKAVLNTAQQLSTAAWISNKQTSSNLSRKPALEYFLVNTTFLMNQPWFNRAVLSLKQRRKTSQEFECCQGHYLIVNHYSSMSWFKFCNLSVIVNCVTKSLNRSKSKLLSL